MANSETTTSTISRLTTAGRVAALLVCVGLLAGAGLAPAENHETAKANGKHAKGGHASEQGPADESERKEPVAGEEASAWTPVLYVPPSRGRAVHSAAGGTRGSTRLGALELAVLAPKDHVALTTRAQPKLYWYVSERVDERIDVTLIDEDSIDPLLELTVPTPVEPGIHAIDLDDHGVELEPGRVYSWHVALVQDATRRSNDLLVEGFIERTGVTPSLERALENGDRRYAPYALSGIWYDAIDALRVAIDDQPRDRRLLLQEVALLEQAELAGVAKFARTEPR